MGAMEIAAICSAASTGIAITATALMAWKYAKGQSEQANAVVMVHALQQSLTTEEVVRKKAEQDRDRYQSQLNERTAELEAERRKSVASSSTPALIDRANGGEPARVPPADKGRGGDGPPAGPAPLLTKPPAAKPPKRPR